MICLSCLFYIYSISFITPAEVLLNHFWSAKPHGYEELFLPTNPLLASPTSGFVQIELEICINHRQPLFPDCILLDRSNNLRWRWRTALLSGVLPPVKNVLDTWTFWSRFSSNEFKISACVNVSVLRWTCLARVGGLSYALTCMNQSAALCYLCHQHFRHLQPLGSKPSLSAKC